MTNNVLAEDAGCSVGLTIRAVTEEELRQVLGRDCSPMRGREGYVIGPDVKGRLCHYSTHLTLAEAKNYARRLNEYN